MPHPWVCERLAHPPQIPKVTVVGASTLGPDAREFPELVCVLGAARSPDEDIAYSLRQPDEVIPFYEDPLAELGRAARAKWL